MKKVTANDPFSALKTTLKAEINADAWATLNSDTSRPVAKPLSGRIAVKVINLATSDEGVQGVGANLCVRPPVDTEPHGGENHVEAATRSRRADTQVRRERKRANTQVRRERKRADT